MKKIKVENLLIQIVADGSVAQDASPLDSLHQSDNCPNYRGNQLENASNYRENEDNYDDDDQGRGNTPTRVVFWQVYV